MQKLKPLVIVIHEPLAQMFFSCTREYTETVLLPRQGTSAFLLLGIRPCEILEIVPLFEDFKSELPIKMTLNMKIIGVLLFHAGAETEVLGDAIHLWA